MDGWRRIITVWDSAANGIPVAVCIYVADTTVTVVVFRQAIFLGRVRVKRRVAIVAVPLGRVPSLRLTRIRTILIGGYDRRGVIRPVAVSVKIHIACLFTVTVVVHLVPNDLCCADVCGVIAVITVNRSHSQRLTICGLAQGIGCRHHHYSSTRAVLVAVRVAGFLIIAILIHAVAYNL
jgi:hypothetical protein